MANVAKSVNQGAAGIQAKAPAKAEKAPEKAAAAGVGLQGQGLGKDKKILEHSPAAEPTTSELVKKARAVKQFHREADLVETAVGSMYLASQVAAKEPTVPGEWAAEGLLKKVVTTPAKNPAGAVGVLTFMQGMHQYEKGAINSNLHDEAFGVAKLVGGTILTAGGITHCKPAVLLGGAITAAADAGDIAGAVGRKVDQMDNKIDAFLREHQ